jgi:hypothetical protein
MHFTFATRGIGDNWRPLDHYFAVGAASGPRLGFSVEFREVVQIIGMLHM